MEAFHYESVFTLTRDRVTLARDRVTLAHHDVEGPALSACFDLARRKTRLKGSEKQIPANGEPAAA
jgi:hypothetical protein